MAMNPKINRAVETARIKNNGKYELDNSEIDDKQFHQFLNMKI